MVYSLKWWAQVKLFGTRPIAQLRLSFPLIMMRPNVSISK